MAPDVEPEVMRTARYVRDHIYENGLSAVHFTRSGKIAIEEAGPKTLEENIHRNLK